MHIKKVFSVVFLLFLMFPVFIEAYGSDWKYKKLITINNTQNSDDLSDYQILINISYIDGMKSDFSDLRFVWFNISSNTETPILYFTENYTNNSFAEIWIKMPEIHANSYETVNMLK